MHSTKEILDCNPSSQIEFAKRHRHSCVLHVQNCLYSSDIQRRSKHHPTSQALARWAVLIWLPRRKPQKVPRQIPSWPEPVLLSYPPLEPTMENGDDFNRFDIFEKPCVSAENSLCFKEQRCVAEKFPVQPNELHLGMTMVLSLISSPWTWWYQIPLAYHFLIKSIGKIWHMGEKCSPLTECLPIKIKAFLLILALLKHRKSTGDTKRMTYTNIAGKGIRMPPWQMPMAITRQIPTRF